MDKKSTKNNNNVKDIQKVKLEEEPAAVVPPDGGWGWVIVFSSLMCNILVDGIGLAYGVLLPKFAEHFQESKSKVSLVGSLMIGTYLCAGPIVSALVNIFGCRPVTIVGSVLAAAGFILGSFSPNLDVLILTYGVISGFGFGMVYLPSIVSVGFYFEKKRPLATGIAVCGSGIGTFIFSPLLEYLSEVYDWKNLLMIMAGIILNGVVCGMLMRPLKASKQLKNCGNISEESSDSGIKIENSKQNTDFDGLQEVDELSFPKDGIHLKEIEPFIQVKDSSLSHRSSRTERRASSLNDISKFGNSRSTPQNTKQVTTHEILYSGSLLYIPQFHSHPNMTHSAFSLASVRPDRKTVWDKCTFLPDSVLSVLKEMLDFSLLLNIPFLLLCIANIFACTGFFIPFYFLVDRALLLHTPSTQAAFLLSIIGITNTIGRVLSGMVANMKNVSALVVNNVALVLASASLFLQPLCTVYPALVVFCVVFGLCVAAFISLTSIILCDLLGVERLANAFGLLTLARGIAGIAGPPVAGMVFQATGNYDASFYFGGGMFFAGAMLHLLLHLSCIKRCNNIRDPEVIVKETYTEAIDKC